MLVCRLVLPLEMGVWISRLEGFECTVTTVTGLVTGAGGVLGGDTLGASCKDAVVDGGFILSGPSTMLAVVVCPVGCGLDIEG